MQESVAGITDHLIRGKIINHVSVFIASRSNLSYKSFFFFNLSSVMMLILIFSTHILIHSSCPKRKFSSGVDGEFGITFSTD